MNHQPKHCKNCQLCSPPTLHWLFNTLWDHKKDTALVSTLQWWKNFSQIYNINGSRIIQKVMLVSFIQRSSLSIQSHSKPLPVLRSVSSWWTTQTWLSCGYLYHQGSQRGTLVALMVTKFKIKSAPPTIQFDTLGNWMLLGAFIWSMIINNTCRSSFFADFYHIPNLENSMGPFSPNIVTPWES